MILLDTQMWVWFNSVPEKVPDAVTKAAPEFSISSVSVWELMLLFEKGRLLSEWSPEETSRRWLARYPVHQFPIDGEIAILSRKLPFEHEDPADRFIAATAFRYGIPLATTDQRLLSLSWLQTIQ